MRILGILIIIAGVALFCQHLVLPSLITIVIGSVFAAIPKKSIPEEEEPSEEKRPSGEENSEYVRVDTPLRKVPPVTSGFYRLTFPVDGVCERNDDGSSRQEILQRLCEGEDMAVADVWFDDFIYAHKIRIRVKTLEGCVGLIRQRDVETVRGFFEKPVRMVYLEIGSSTDSSGERRYHAEVIIIANRE